MRDRIVDGLMDVLERERGALRRGDVTGASRLSARKEKLLDRLVPARIAPDQLARLREAADRNAQLLMACRKGIEAARERLAELRNPKPDTTYSARGEKYALRVSQTTMSRRA